MRRYLVSAVCGTLFLASLSLAAQEFPVNTSKVGLQICPAIVANPEGGYLVLFGSITSGLSGGRPGVLAQRVGASGERIGAELMLDATTAFTCLTAVPAGPGRVLVVWGEQHDITQMTVRARFVDFQGAPLGPRFLAGEGAPYSSPGAACDAEGNCWIGWIDNGTTQVWARRFGLSGQPLGEEIRLDAPSDEGKRWGLDFSADGQGGFIASWWLGSTETGPPEEPQPPPNGQVRIRRVSATGELLGEQIAIDPVDAVHAYSDGQTCPAPGGGFFAALSRVRIDLSAPAELLLRRFDASGAPSGPTRFVTTVGSPRAINNLTLDCGAGRILLTWIGYAGASVTMSGRLFNLAGEPLGAPDVETEITVTDTVSGSWKTYRNPPRSAFLPIQDTRAFDCP